MAYPSFVEHVMETVSDTPMQYALVEAALLLSVVWILLKTAYDPRAPAAVRVPVSKLTTLLDNWNPQPLVFEVNPDHPALKPRIIGGKAGKYIDVDGTECLNLGTHNYLGFIGNSQIEERAIKTIQKYGVGSCGPRGFYGTVDVHLDLEEKLATLMGMEEAALFSYGFSTIASVIPAYAKRSDIIYVDKEINFAAQKGLDASRSTIVTFKHNDVEDLESLLIAHEKLAQKNPRKAKTIRRFLVVEGIYMNTGTICPLPELIRLKNQYKLRIFIDETVSFGTLGASGKGVTEHFNIPVADVDLIIGTLECATASIGGFSVGSAYVVEHQRLSALGYCFSASLPPLLTTAASEALELMEQDPSMFATLKARCQQMHAALLNVGGDKMELLGHEESPVKHLVISDPRVEYRQHDKLLASMTAYCLRQKIAITPSAYLSTDERFPRRASIRVTVNNLLSDEDIRLFASVLTAAVEHCL